MGSSPPPFRLSTCPCVVPARRPLDAFVSFDLLLVRSACLCLPSGYLLFPVSLPLSLCPSSLVNVGCATYLSLPPYLPKQKSPFIRDQVNRNKSPGTFGLLLSRTIDQRVAWMVMDASGKKDRRCLQRRLSDCRALHCGQSNHHPHESEDTLESFTA